MARRKRLSAPLYLGCAGWSLSREQQAKFPGEGTHLERYAQVFSSVEINSSFYRPHRPETYARWRNSVPENFRFAVKVPREITHLRRLLGCEDLLDRFLGEAGCLEEKLGCLLVQLPPGLRYDPAAHSFFGMLRQSVHCAIACEPRHASWFTEEVTAMMSAYDVARVEADPSPVSWIGVAHKASLAYLRLHGSPEMYHSAYSKDFLDRLAVYIRQLSREKTAVWCVFDNTANGAAMPDALALQARLY